MGDASFITWLSAVPLALFLGSIVAAVFARRSDRRGLRIATGAILLIIGSVGLAILGGVLLATLGAVLIGLLGVALLGSGLSERAE